MMYQTGRRKLLTLVVQAKRLSEPKRTHPVLLKAAQ